MNYELAKQLKDAGFPQVADDNGTLRKGGSYLFPEGTNLAMSQKKLTQRVAYAPTLEELIKACGKITLTTQKPCKAYKHGVPESECYGATPSEAVAKLWLALNNKTPSLE